MAITETADPDGWTSLHLAASKGHLEIAKILIEKGAEKEAIDANGRTPLNVAASSGCFEIVKMLLENGAKRKSADLDGLMALELELELASQHRLLRSIQGAVGVFRVL